MTKYAHRTQAAAAARGKFLAESGAHNVVDQCAHEVIVNVFGIPSPWKWGGNGHAWAINYFKGAKKVVKTTDPNKIPAGAMCFFGPRAGATTNGGLAGHVAIGAGNGYIYSTDLPHPGHWGRVKATEVTRLWGKHLVGYVIEDGMGYTLTDPPKVKPPKPDTLFRYGQWSLAGFDTVYGKAHWDKTAPGVVKELVRLDAKVWSLTEVPGPKVKSFDKSLKEYGLSIAISNNGRTIVVKDGVRVGRTKAVELKERGPAKDNKQIVLAEVWPTDSHFAWVIEAGHFEHRSGAAYDKTRVTQGKEARAATLAFAKECGVDVSRIIFGDDENSISQVLDEAYHPDFVDVLDVAWLATNRVWATIVGWLGKSRKGFRTDKIKVHIKRKVTDARVSTKSVRLKVSDHAPTIVDIAKN